MSSLRRYAFTLNNYTCTQVEALNRSLDDDAQVRYALYGKEVSDSGTPHLQGYISLKSKKRLGAMKKLFGNEIHFEGCKGSEQSNIDYCSKDGDVTTFGTPSTQGKRSDLDAVKEAIDNGATLSDLNEEHFGCMMRYGKNIASYHRSKHNTPKQIPNHSLREWQSDLADCLKLPADERTIAFVVDYKGNEGKTWFTKHISNIYGTKVQVMKPGKKADMAYELRNDIKIYFLDCTRVQTERIPYDFLEELKDGSVFSGKYESVTKHMADNLHVVVLMNSDPDMRAMSQDRYHIIKL